MQVPCVELCQERVSAGNPASESNSVCYINKLVGSYVVEVLEKGLLEQLGVKMGDSVDFVRTHNTQVSHSYPFGDRLLHDR